MHLTCTRGCRADASVAHRGGAVAEARGGKGGAAGRPGEFQWRRSDALEK